MSNCERFTGRLRDICEGKSGLSPELEKKYRVRLGVELAAETEGHKKTANRGRKKGCGGCRRRKGVLNRVVRGLGNAVEKFTRWTGIKCLVDARADARRDRLVAELLADTEIIVKSFMRQDSLLRFVQSVRKFYPTIPIRVADDSPTLTTAGRQVQQIPGVTWHQMLFDQGLPAGRNLAVRESSAKYLVLCDDDYIFTEDTDLAALLLPVHFAGLDLCGGLVRDDTGKLKNWCGLLRFQGDGRGKKVVMSPAATAMEEIEGVRIRRIDVTYNFFVARRELLLKHPWDERYIIAQEHLDSFLTWSQAGAKMAYTIDCSCNHSHSLNTTEYKRLRRRTNNAVFNRKWGVSGHKAKAVTTFSDE